MISANSRLTWTTKQDPGQSRLYSKKLSLHLSSPPPKKDIKQKQSRFEIIPLIIALLWSYQVCKSEKHGKLGNWPRIC